MKKLRSQGRAFAAMIKCCVQVGPTKNDFFFFPILYILLKNTNVTAADMQVSMFVAFFKY